MSNEFESGTSSRTKALIAAMLARAGQPNPSLGGAVGHGLAAGILGMIEGQDRRDNAAAMEKVISLYSPDSPPASAPTPAPTAPMPTSPPAMPPRTEAPAVSKEMLVDSLTDKPADLSGGFLPKDGVDRSKFAALGQPGPLQDKFVQYMGGEGGFKDPANDQMLAESTLNRALKMAAAKGMDPVAYLEKDLNPAPKGGYFDSRTPVGGARVMGTPGESRFRNETLASVLGGSDFGTKALGFTPDGNASGSFADNRAANGVYQQFAKAPSGEMFVNQFKGDVPRTYGLSSVMGPPVGAPPIQPPQTASLPPAGMVPQAGLTEGAKITNVPTRPVEPTMQTAQARPPQVAPAPQAAPSVPTLPSDPTTKRLMEAYRTASPREREKLGPMVLQQLQTARQQQLEMQKQIYLEDYKRNNPNYAERFGTYADRNKGPLAYQEKSGTLAAENDAAPATAARQGLEKQATTEGEVRGKIRANLPQAEATLEQTLKDSEGLRNHPGRQSSMGDIMGNLPDWMIRSNTDAKDFISRLNQVKGESFLKAYETLKGGGSITEVEGTKATAAINRMNRATTQKEFESALNDYQDSVRTGLAKLREVAGESPRQQPQQPTQGGAVKSYKDYFK